MTGILSLVSALANIGAYVVTGNTEVLIPGDPKTTIFLWDRFIIMGLGVIYLVLGLTRSGPRWGRLVGAIFVLVAGVAILVDDMIQGGQEYYSDQYLGLIMLLVIALIPYQPRQALAFVFGIWGAYLVSYGYLPVLLGFEGRVLDPRLFIYILIVMFFCIGLSALLYHSRYEQYRARRSAEQLKEQVEAQAEKLVAAERLKARFFANISHEFRTPLTLILGPVTDALDDAYGPLNGTLRSKLHVMRRSGLRLQRLINQLLDLSKLEAGHMHLHARRRDLIAFLRGIVGAFSSLAERKDITLHLYTEKEPLLLSFDAEKLEKVVVNLLSNAVKFTPEQGTIRVVVREGTGEDGAFTSSVASGSCAEICVRDTGPGIPPEELPHVFDRFHQVEHAMAHEHAGSGIGLALAKELVELHGGEIRVESEPGFGCAFFVLLPLSGERGRSEGDGEVEIGTPTQEIEDLEWAVADEARPFDSAPLSPEPFTMFGKPKILIVEDNADVREYLRSHLGAFYHVVEAADGEEGLAKARAVGPDLVISDVMMPKMDGVALCNALKTDEHLNHIPVILLTAKADEASKMKGLKMGTDEYLTKPFNAKELITRVENLIEIRRLLRQRFSGEVVVGPNEIAVPSVEAAFVERVRAAVERHMGTSNFGVAWLADEVGMSVRNLRRRLKAATGLSPGGYIRMMRLERAKQLLVQQAGTVSEVAFQVGFQDSDYFSRLFKQTVGVPPSAYRTKRP